MHLRVLDPPEGPTARIKCRLNNQRGDQSQYLARTQEMPAVYTNGSYHRLMTYAGDKPFTGDKLTRIVSPGEPSRPLDALVGHGKLGRACR